MTNILVLYYQPIIGDNPYNLACLYDSMFSELKDAGNKLLLMNMSIFKKDYFSAKIHDEDNVVNKIKKFNPEVVITFNNQVFDKLFNITNCPIALFEADAYEFFSCKELLHKNINRYTLFINCKEWTDKYVDLGFSKNQIHFMPVATSVKQENLPLDKNISFIGTFFSTAGNTFAKFGDEKRDIFYKAYLEFLKTKNYDYKSYFPEDTGLDVFDYHPFFDIRLLTLVHILDLGLTLHGVLWEPLKTICPHLYCAFDSTPKFSLKHNQDLYNSSKICININHPQCNGDNFAWRGFDIMASNGCLVSSYSKQLIRATKGWVDIPMYHSPIEARELCVKLLNNENMRKDIVEASQKYVDANCRWVDRFKQIENIINVKLVNENEVGCIDILESKVKANTTTKTKKRSRLFHLNTRIFKKVSLNIDLERI